MSKRKHNKCTGLFKNYVFSQKTTNILHSLSLIDAFTVIARQKLNATGRKCSRLEEKLKETMAKSQIQLLIDSLDTERDNNNHIGRTFDCNVIKSETLILLSKVGLSRTLDRSRHFCTNYIGSEERDLEQNLNSYLNSLEGGKSNWLGGLAVVWSGLALIALRRGWLIRQMCGCRICKKHSK